MTRTSTFTFATLAALAVASLAPNAVFAHGGGMGGGGHSFAGGFSSSPSPVGHVSTSGGYAHGPSSVGRISRSSVVARIKGKSGISRNSLIARLPVGSSKSGVHKIPTVSRIPQLVKPVPVPPVTVQTPDHNKTRYGTFDATTGEATADAVCVDNQNQAERPDLTTSCCPIRQTVDDAGVVRDVCARDVVQTPAQPSAQAQTLQ